MTEQNQVSISELQQQANDGDSQAQFDLAYRYARGVEVEENKEEALLWLKKAAEQGLVSAQLALGYCHYGVRMDYEYNQERFNKQLMKGFRGELEHVPYYLGVVLSSDDVDTESAFHWFTNAANQGNAEAQYNLAYCYHRGIGVNQNDDLALKWFSVAAERGHENARALAVALCLTSIQREAEIQNYKHTFEKLTKAAELGSIDAYLLLGMLYISGKGIEQNHELAVDWFKKAAEKGLADAQYWLARCYLTGMGIEQNDEYALNWLEKAHEQGHTGAKNVLATHYLAMCTQHFYNEERDKEKDGQAFNWCEFSAKNGLADAYFLLGYCYWHGWGVEKCNDLAVKWLQRAVDCFENVENESKPEWIPFAHIILGNSYSKGTGVEKNDALAEQYYQHANSDYSRDQLSNSLVEQVMKTSAKSRYAKEVLPMRIEMHIANGEHDLAKQFAEEAFEYIDGSEKNYRNICLTTIIRAEQLNKISQELEEKNKALESEIKQKEEAYKALHDKEKEMLSFFTHTMRNALATAPEALRQAIQLLGSEVYEKDSNHYKAINKIASLFSSLSLTDCLIDTFKQSISDPEEFKQAWENDHSGEASPKWVLASALRQSLNRIIFMSDTSDLRKLLEQPEAASIKAMRKSFIDDVLPLNVDAQGIDKFYQWVDEHIACLEINLSDIDQIRFGANQTRFSLLFAIASELLLNALRYWDGSHTIQIRWQLNASERYVLSVKNHCQPNAISRLAGTHKGLAFIKRLIELLGEQAQFSCNVEDQFFNAELSLNKTLFDEAS